MWTAMIFVCVFVICTKFDWLVQECSKYIERCDVFTMLFLLIFQNSLEWVVRQGKCLFKFVLILILYKYKVCTQVKWLKISVYKWSFYAFLLPPPFKIGHLKSQRPFVPIVSVRPSGSCLYHAWKDILI